MKKNIYIHIYVYLNYFVVCQRLTHVIKARVLFSLTGNIVQCPLMQPWGANT